MIFPDQLPELPSFYRAEKQIRINHDSSFANLVVAGQNQEQPIYRWFRYKESFSPNLVKRIIANLYPTPQRLSLLDPFCGVGTTLLAAQEMAENGYQISAIGIERNPFSSFVAETKLAWSKLDPLELLSIGSELLDKITPARDLPSLSSIATARCISHHMARKVVGLRDAIHSQSSGATRKALLLGLASAIEPLSKVRRDGRALRLVAKPLTRFHEEVSDRWSDIAIDVLERSRSNIPNQCQIQLLEGDGRAPDREAVRAHSLDLVITSPPYPNNIDYNEIYKLELWLLGFTSTAENFLRLRKETFRSHPTCAEPIEPPEFTRALQKGRLSQLLQPLVARVDAHTEHWRRKVLRGYLADLWSSLANYWTALKPGGRVVFVVGNSLHGTSDHAYLIPTDLAISVMGDALGYETDELIVARGLKRRLATNHFLRESIVSLRKP